MFIPRWLIVLVRPLVDRFPRIATIYRSVRDETAFNKEPIMTPWNFKLAGNPAMAKGTFEPTETELVRNLLKDVDILVNVGANIGYYCCHALSMGKSVIAFEPVRRNLRYLCQNIKTNNWSDIEIYPVALSNSVGVLEIYGADTGASIVKGWAGTPENFKSLVPASTMNVVLNNRLHGKKALVLVDIEGAEKWMLEGASKLLANEPKPIWLVEITTNELQPSGVEVNPNFKSTFQLFFQHGYQAFNVDDDMKPITMEQIDLASRGLQNFNNHNFLFRETKSVI